MFQSRFEKLIDKGTISLESAEPIGLVTYNFEKQVLKYWEFRNVVENGINPEYRCRTGKAGLKGAHDQWRGSARLDSGLNDISR